MKKLLFVFASLALVATANAEGTEMKASGDFRVRYWNNDNPAGAAAATADAESHWDQRANVGFTFAKSEDLTFHIGLNHSNTWGTAPVQSGTHAGTADLLVTEAWGFWKSMDNLAVKFGRGALDWADGTVIARNEWEQTPKVFEGIMANYYTEWATIGFFGVKGVDTFTAGSATDVPEGNFYGLTFDVKNLPDWMSGFKAHLLQEHGYDTGAGNPGSRMRYGVTLDGGMNNVDYRVAYNAYSGEDDSATPVDFAASMMEGELGYTFTDFMNTRLSFLYHSDSGDESTTDNELGNYNAFHYDAHNNAGFMDIVDWGNSTYIKAGLGMDISDSTTFGVDYYMFSLTETDGTNTKTLNGGVFTHVNAAEDEVGSEIDVVLKKMYDNGMWAQLRYGTFSAGKAVYAAAGSEPEGISQITLAAGLNF